MDKIWICIGIGLTGLVLWAGAGFSTAGAQSEIITEDSPPPGPAPEPIAPGEPDVEDMQLMIGAASVCEAVKNGIPRNEAIVFSISLGRVYCFSDFLSVPQQTFIYHHWYYQDQNRASVKLLVRPPRWSTYSSLQLRATDVGPWRVEITTEDGSVLRTLRFSILE
jgi:hypothetical protein